MQQLQYNVSSICTYKYILCITFLFPIFIKRGFKITAGSCLWLGGATRVDLIRNGVFYN